MQTKISIKGTHCHSCKALIEDVCRDIEGVISCIVDYQTGETIVEHKEELNWDVFREEIEGLGEYKVV
ncbi:heavy-metal-associated domain-containing protein [Candidatus Uhrbacteria bacterium]|nr:heavy-metal-associated domain-containing protein [Candidatus Uhrbacteria bacterium]